MKLFLTSLWGKGYVGTVRLVFRFLEDSLLDPFTSKVTKTAVLGLKCLEPLSMLYASKKKYRPITLRALRRPGEPPIYLTLEDYRKGARWVRVERGEVLEAEVAYFAEAPLRLASCREELRTSRIKAEVWVAGGMAASVESLANSSEPQGFRVKIETPLVIATKLMAPPGARNREISEVIKRASPHPRLLVTPSYLLAQAAREWAAIVQGLEASETYYYLGRIADVLIAETKFRLRPVKAVYGKGKRGPKVVKGVVGWLELKVLHPSIASAAARLLAFASYMGLGRSRSIGFGEVKVTTL